MIHVNEQQVQLSDVLSEFARTMLTDFPIQSILDHLVVRIVDVLPVDAAGVTLITTSLQPRYIAASNDSALEFERLQSELGEGPCLTAYRSGDAVAVTHLRNDSRFSVFGERAVAFGLGAVFAFPLRHGDQPLGALDLYSSSAGALSPAVMASAQTLADVVAAYLLNAQARADLEDFSERSRHAASHDELTGLPNRVLMIERLEHATARGRRSGGSTAVLFADLDHFKAVNDTHGHRTGDELLVAVARRMSALLRPRDTLARLSGDEFVILCEDLESPAQAAAIGNRMQAALDQPFQISGGRTVKITASIGIVFAGHGDNPAAVLLDAADAAMYRAKRRGGGRHTISVHELPRPHLELPIASDPRAAPTGIDHDLPGALARGEFYLEYQPIVANSDGRIGGLEALVRWSHPIDGLIEPTTLIPLAERSDDILKIGGWVLERALEQSAAGRLAGSPADLSISVNVSGHQLIAAGFAASVAQALRYTHTDPPLLTLGLTESVLIRESRHVLDVLKDLKDLGVLLALDDFGTGYSSLNYLRRFPVDVVKIEKAFVAGLGADRPSTIIVGAVVRLSHRLGMTVVAEGVETADQHRRVIELGCDHSQGFYFAPPMSATDMLLLLEHTNDGSFPPAGELR